MVTSSCTYVCILGDERDETNLLKIVNNTIDLVGTKKAIYGNCDIGANHFSRWVKNRLNSVTIELF